LNIDGTPNMLVGKRCRGAKDCSRRAGASRGNMPRKRGKGEKPTAQKEKSCYHRGDVEGVLALLGNIPIRNESQSFQVEKGGS